MTRFITSVTLAALLLSGCGSKSGYPSLAKRPQERISATAPVVAPTPTAEPAALAPDLALQARLARYQQQARDAHNRFIAAAPKATRLVNAARGAAVASESWSLASVALAELESRRSEAMVALADLDALYVKDRIDGGDGGTITAVRDQITASVADEDAVLADLKGRFGS